MKKYKVVYSQYSRSEDLDLVEKEFEAEDDNLAILVADPTIGFGCCCLPMTKSEIVEELEMDPSEEGFDKKALEHLSLYNGDGCDWVLCLENLTDEVVLFKDASVCRLKEEKGYKWGDLKK